MEINFSFSNHSSGVMIHKSWKPFFKSNEERLNHIFEFIQQDPNTIPNLDCIYKPFELPLSELNVVIVGQNPYNTAPGIANGIAFSIDEGTDVTATLRVISKELDIEYGKPLEDYTLSHWIKQGVLLLNSSMTINLKDTEPEFSHEDIWSFFMENLLYWISRNKPHTIFMLWGKSANRYTKVLKGADVTVMSTPFPLQRSTEGKSFLNSGVFEKCNSALSKVGKGKINWC